VPRSRVIKDDALLELASTKPTTTEELGRSRLLLREGRKGDIADGLLAAVKAGLEMRPEDMPKVEAQPGSDAGQPRTGRPVCACC
jgi:ribonuclease D